MLTGCIFDLDGTLVDTLPTVHYYCNRTLTHFGLGEVTLDQCRSLCRLSIAEFYPGLLRYGGCPEDRIEALREPIRQYDLEGYLQDIHYLTKPYPGIEDTLRRLRAAGVVTAALTNKPAPLAESLLTSLFPGLLDAIAGQTPDSISKPDPRSLTNLLDRLGLKVDQALYVGDTDVDMRTAQNAGAAACAVTWGYQTREELQAFHPDYIVDTPNALCSIFQLNKEEAPHV